MFNLSIANIIRQRSIFFAQLILEVSENSLWASFSVFFVQGTVQNSTWMGTMGMWGMMSLLELIEGAQDLQKQDSTVIHITHYQEAVQGNVWD